MNKNAAVIGGIIIIVLIAGIFLFGSQSSLNTGNNATSTAATTTGTANPLGTSGGNATGAPADRTPGIPVVTTNSTVAPTDTTAVVTGTVIPMGAITAYWYEYGTTANLGSKTANQNAGSGFSTIPTPGYIKGLTKSTTYYYRLVAENSFGQVVGNKATFTTTSNTPAPVGNSPTAKTLSASGITRTSANLRGDVNPNSGSTQYWFEYGTDGNLGNTTAFTSIGSGGATVSASAAIANLAPGTTYYYRVNAQNQYGTQNGAILTFKTSGPISAAPSATTHAATDITASGATLRGSVDPNGAETTYWFEYSSDSLLGSVLLKTTPQKSAGSGTQPVAVEAPVANLNGKTTYFARLVAQNSSGTVRGDKMSFKTK